MAPNSDNFEFSFRTRQSSWDTIKADPSRLHNAVIIGGGIVGAGIARQLAFSGVSDVLLIEKGDFASGTSSVSSKLIHAGIRYLEQSWIYLKSFQIGAALRNFNFVIQASLERKVLGRLAPGLITPKIIYLVVSKSDKRNIFSVWLGIWLYYLIQIFQGQFFSPPSLRLNPAALKSKFPGLNPDPVKAVFSFWDSETDDARLVIENLQDAHRRDVKILNYVELVSYVNMGEQTRLVLKNLENNEEISIGTKLLVNASGPWVDQVRSRSAQPITERKLVDRVAGGHLDVYPAISPNSFYITAGDGRLVFILKREEDGLIYSRIGTTERPLKSQEKSDHIKPTPDEIHYLKNAVREYFPDAPLDTANILHLDEGIRPLRSQEGTAAFNKSREHEIIIEDRVVHVVGVKLTDFRRAAGDLVRALNWKSFGIPISSLGIVSVPLRSPDLPGLYAEDNLEKLISRTMILHWQDYLERRRGRWPAFLAHYHPEKLEKDLHEMGRQMGWDSSRVEMERLRSN